MGVELLYSAVKTEVKGQLSRSRVVDGVRRVWQGKPKGPSGALIELGSREDADKMQ